MDAAVSERVELAKFCSSRDWSKAIRVLDSLLAQSYAIQDICNRAFCYSQLELHKHVVKDCDKALQLDPMLLQAYILKGRAFSALGRKEEALAVWEQGYQNALRQSADLKQLLELEELLTVAKGKQGGIISSENHKSESGLSVPESKAYMNGKAGQSDPVSESKAYMNGKCGLSVPVSDSKAYVNGKSNEDSEGQNKNVSLKLCSESMKVSVPVSESKAYMNGKSNEASEGQNKNVSLKLCSEPMKVSEHRRSDSDHSCTTENGISDKMKGKSLLSESVHVTSAKSGNTFKGLSELSKVSLSSSNGKDDSEVHDDKCGDNFKTAGKLGDKTSANGNPSNGMNGTHGIDEMSNAAESLKDLCGESEQCSTSSMIVSSPRDVTEVRFKSVNQSDSNGVTSNEAKRNKKFCIAKISKTKSISVDFRLSRGIAQVNEGNYANAISIFNQILREDPTYPEALIGRGTAYAFQRELEAAIADFSKALESNPSAGEAWKRRGQARAALGESVEAIRDLTKALEFEPNSADILHERGIVNFKFKDLHAAVEDLSECVKLDKDNKSAYTYLGSAYSSIGEYKRAEEAHLKSIQLDQRFIEAWASLTQFYQDLANSKKAMECVQRVLLIDASYAKAYHLRGLLLHGMGEHRKAIVDLSIGLSIEKSNVECLYLRGSCYHAIGEYREAAKDYDAALDVELDSMEKFVLQCLAFYQKEIALYTASKVSSDFCWFDIDGDIDPLFKEYWCKRLHPKNVCEKVYRQPTLRESLKKGKLKKQDFAITKQRTALLLAADSIGKRIQCDCPGFLPNRRQHRMAGLAAIEIAQKVSKAWRSLRAELKNSNKGSKNGKRVRRKERISMASQNRGGACCSTSSSAETSTAYGITEDKLSGRSMMSWHDVYALAVRWRQISEPCDPVVWVNKLSEEFNSGFGSHTPMILGQAKVVRYFPNYERTLDKAKTIMKDKLYVNNKADKIINLAGEENSEKISNAKSCDDLYKIVGEDFWLATWCNSTAFEGKQLEGTRITLVKMGERGYDFAIRTPCTPSRWEEFDAEMALAWEALCNAYCGDTYGSTDFDALENVREAILRMTYYWYNFMPLSRGTAVVGFVVLLGLFLAANMEFTGSIPKGVQLDWEAILNLDPNSFVDSVKSWLYPSLKIKTSWKDNPDVASTFSTTGSVVAALSTYDD